jgi:hypothetical protein
MKNSGIFLTTDSAILGFALALLCKAMDSVPFLL